MHHNLVALFQGADMKKVNKQTNKQTIYNVDIDEKEHVE